MAIKSREKILIIMVVVIGVLVLGNLLVWSPLQSAYASRSEAIAKLTKDIASGKQLLTQEPSLSASWKEFKQRSLPGDKAQAVDDVMKAVDRWTTNANFARRSLSPQWTVDQPDRAELEVRITGQGNIGTIAQFLYNMETDPLPVKIEETNISASDAKGSNLNLMVRFSGVQIRTGKEVKGARGRGAVEAGNSNAGGTNS